jgi:hypothetical protein
MEWLLTGLTTAATDELFRAHATVKSGRRGDEDVAAHVTGVNEFACGRSTQPLLPIRMRVSPG